MTIRHTIAVAAVSAVALMSGAVLAADFSSELSEARVASQSAGRDIREAVTPALNVARSLSEQGAQDKAQDYLSYARGKLGLPTGGMSADGVVIASPVVAAPETAVETAGSFTEQLMEAKVASQVSGRATREAVTPALNAAQSLHARGFSREAQDQLNFARGKLGLSRGPAIMAAPVLDTPYGTGKADKDGIIGLRDERS